MEPSFNEIEIMEKTVQGKGCTGGGISKQTWTSDHDSY
jgi:hypothetical protein